MRIGEKTWLYFLKLLKILQIIINKKMDDDQSSEDFVIDCESEITNYTCSICRELFYRPVTLICQHSYCYECLEEYYNSDGIITDTTFPEIRYQSQKKNKCPLCNIPYTLPPMENKMLSTLVEEKFPDEYQERRDYFENEKALEEKKEKMEQTMRQEIWNMLSTNFNTNDPPQPQTINDFSEQRRQRMVVANYMNTWSYTFNQVKNDLIRFVPMLLAGATITVAAATASLYIEKSIRGPRK